MTEESSYYFSDQLITFYHSLDYFESSKVPLLIYMALVENALYKGHNPSKPVAHSCKISVMLG